MDDRGERRGRRFAILRHELPLHAARPSHWDLLLEHRGILLTWELPTLGFENLPATFEQLAIRRLADHRTAYLTYEGPVSNDRGSVNQVDSGDYRIADQGSAEWVEVEATGRLYHFKLRLLKGCFNDGLNNIKPDRAEFNYDLSASPIPFFAIGEVLEFACLGQVGDRPSP